MKFKIIIVAVISLFSLQAYGQWEYQYFVARVGAVHGFMNAQPETAAGRYILTGDGEIPLQPATASTPGFYLPYSVGFNASIFFNYDFKNDKKGIIIGAEYISYPSVAKYATKKDDFWMIERLDVISFGIPVLFKWSKEMYDNQKYFYAGLQYNFNIDLRQKQTVSWTPTKKSSWENKSALEKNSISIIAGFNFLIFNIEMNYIPVSMINPQYTIDGKILPFKEAKDNKFYVKTGLTIPLNEWTTSKNWYLHKLTRRWKL